MTTNGMDHSIGRWWDESLTPQDGCIWPDPPGPPRGCANCWAKRMNKRWRRPTDDRLELHPERLDKVLARRKPTIYGVPINCGDLFQESVPNDFVDECVAVFDCSPQHTFVLVTKRWQRCADHWRGFYAEVPPEHSNIYLTFSVWDQASTSEACAVAATLPVGVRWVLALEPMVGPVDMRQAQPQTNARLPAGVIVGGENGPGAAPLDPAWVRVVRDQCASAGVPFYLKSLRKEGGAVVRLLDGRTHNALLWGGEVK